MPSAPCRLVFALSLLTLIALAAFASRGCTHTGPTDAPASPSLPAAGATPAVIYASPSSLIHTTARLSIPRTGVVACSVGSQAFFFGGEIASGAMSTRIDIYDAAANRWSTHEMVAARTGEACTAVGPVALCAGGRDGRGGPLTDSVDVYDARTGRWSTARLSEARWCLIGVTCGRRAYFAGGQTDRTRASRVIDVFDLDSGRWSTLQLPHGRNDSSAAAVGTRIIFLGGQTADGSLDPVIDILDTATGRWTTRPLAHPRVAWAGHTAVAGRQAVFAGGSLSRGGSPVAAWDIYDLDTDLWTSGTLARPDVAVSSVGLGPLALFAGGFRNGPLVTVYDSRTRQWSATPDPLTSGGFGLGATAVRTPLGLTALFAGRTGDGTAVDMYTLSIVSPPPARPTRTSPAEAPPTIDILFP
jgi:hypothetical protein